MVRIQLVENEIGTFLATKKNKGFKVTGERDFDKFLIAELRGELLDILPGAIRQLTAVEQEKWHICESRMKIAKIQAQQELIVNYFNQKL